MRQAAEAGSGAAENVAWTHTHVGLLLFNRGDLAGAQSEYEVALRALPGYVPADAGLARVLAEQGNLNGAIARLEHDTQVMPLPEYVIALGDTYMLAGRSLDAQRQYALVDVIAQLQRANGVVTDMEMALYQADHASAQKDLNQTVDLARRALQERPTIYAADTLAWTLFQAGEYAEAQTFSQQALRLGTQDALLWFHAGMIDAKLGRKADAAQKLLRALDYNPHFSLLWASQAKQTLAEVR
jgi:predicted Zn-dependent protease